MAYTNSQILSAVISKWAQPVIIQFAQNKMQVFPFVQAIENKIKSTGFVSPNYSIVRDLSSIIEPITNSIVHPMINSYLSNIPDEAIPKMAHEIVDKAIKDGKLELMEGKIIFDKDDLEELKNLLDYNLPITAKDEYIVITQPGRTSQEAI